MRIACFGKVTRDETIYLETPVLTGNNSPVRAIETVYGGMVSWAGKSLHKNGHTPVMFGCAGMDTPPHYVGHRSEDYLVRQGEMHHIRVLVDPDGQRTFLAPVSDSYPEYRIDAISARNLDAVMVDGYSLLPQKADGQASDLVFTAQDTNPNIPVVVTLPVSQKLDRSSVSHLVKVIETWGKVYVCGGVDEHEKLPDGLPEEWIMIHTTGPQNPFVIVKQGNQTVHVEPVGLVEKPKNTNGAGDVFASGIASSLAANHNIQEAIQYAHQIASTHVVREPSTKKTLTAYQPVFMNATC